MKRFLLALIGFVSCAAHAVDCIPSGVTDQFTYFVAVDSVDFTTRETGLTTFTVRRSRNGGASAAFTTPTINETDSANMPGVYELLLDEDMTIDSGDDVQHMTLHITHAGMAPVTKEICIARAKVTAGNTLAVASDGDLIEVNTLTGHTVQTGDAFARLGAPAGASVSADIAAIEAQTDDIGVAGAGLTAIDLPNQTMDIIGNLSGSVGSVATDGINAASIAADAIGSSELAATAAGEVADQVWEEAIGDHSATVGSTAEALAAAGGGGATDQELGILRQGTAASATATTLVMDSGAAFADDTAIGMTVVVCGSTQGYCQSRAVTDNTGANDTLTVDTWTVTPSGTITFYLFGTAPGAGGGGLDAAGVRAAVGLASANLDTQLSAIDNYIDTEVADILVDTSTTLDDFVDDLEARLGTPANLGGGATIAQNLSDIEGQTNDIGAAGAGLTAADDAVLAAIAALNNVSLAQIRDITVEDQAGGGNISLACAIAAILAYAGGDVSTTGTSSTYEDPSGTETRIAGTTTSPGNRTATITCPTL